MNELGKPVQLTLSYNNFNYLITFTILMSTNRRNKIIIKGICLLRYACAVINIIIQSRFITI